MVLFLANAAYAQGLAGSAPVAVHRRLGLAFSGPQPSPGASDRLDGVDLARLNPGHHNRSWFKWGTGTLL